MTTHLGRKLNGTGVVTQRILKASLLKVHVADVGPDRGQLGLLRQDNLKKTFSIGPAALCGCTYAGLQGRGLHVAEAHVFRVYHAWGD